MSDSSFERLLELGEAVGYESHTFSRFQLIEKLLLDATQGVAASFDFDADK